MVDRIERFLSGDLGRDRAERLYTEERELLEKSIQGVNAVLRLFDSCEEFSGELPERIALTDGDTIDLRALRTVLGAFEGAFRTAFYYSDNLREPLHENCDGQAEGLLENVRRLRGGMAAVVEQARAE